MAGLLPSQMRCSAFWYAQARGLPTDLDYLKALGLTAYRMAVWEGLAPWQVPEGPFLVYMWPERVFDAAATGLVREYRDPGCGRCDYGTHCCPGCGEPLPHGTGTCCNCGPAPSHGYREAGDCSELDVIPPWCPLPQGDQARFAIGY